MNLFLNFYKLIFNILVEPRTCNFKKTVLFYIFSDVTETKAVDQIDNLNSLKLTLNCHLQVIFYQSYLEVFSPITSKCNIKLLLKCTLIL